MKIVEKYSHLNGLEYLLVHNPKLWAEIKNVIKAVDAEKCKSKVSKERRMIGKLLYSPNAMNKMFKEELSKYNWLAITLTWGLKYCP